AGAGGADPGSKGKPAPSGAGNTAREQSGAVQELPPALPDEIRDIVANWSKYTAEIPKGSRHLALSRARLSLGDHGQLLILFEKEYGNPYMYQRKDDEGESRERVDNDRRELRNYLQGKVGKAVEIEYRVLDRGKRITDNYIDLLSLVESGAIRMEVDIEDD
ncbi:MAG: hypothetical protein Q4D81_09540, partial [Eubacteriales bacterium]|nr:hypothetical protein [Eubacteriales bacterium]